MKLILKARIGLTKKTITNKAGKKQTVYIRAGEKKKDNGDISIAHDMIGKDKFNALPKASQKRILAKIALSDKGKVKKWLAASKKQSGNKLKKK